MRPIYWMTFLVWTACLITAGMVVLRGNRLEKKDGLTVGASVPVAPEFTGGHQCWPEIAWGKDCYVVVWQEGAAYEGAPDANIMTARLSPEGKPIDLKGIVVCKAKHHQIYPKVTFDGDNFLVAWQDYRNGQDWDVYAARISPEGKVLDPDGFPLADGPGNQVHPTLASNGKQTLAVWSDLRPNPSGPERYVLAGTFTYGGKPEKLNGTVLSENGKNGSLLGAIARWDGESYLVAAQKHPAGWEYGGPWLIRVSLDGKVELVHFDFFGHSYALAADPKSKRNCLWSYLQYGHGSYNCAFQCAVWPKGDRHLVVGMPQHYAPVNELWAAAAFDGVNFVVVSERGTEIKDATRGDFVEVDLVATRVSPTTGQPLDFGHVPYDGKDVRNFAKLVDEVRPRASTGVIVAAEKYVFERHPALASSGDGRSVLVYSRHAGPRQFTLRCVLLSEQP